MSHMFKIIKADELSSNKSMEDKSSILEKWKSF